jgi:hypothetical protein
LYTGVITVQGSDYSVASLRNPWFISQEPSQFLQFLQLLRSLGKEIKYEKTDMDYLIYLLIHIHQSIKITQKQWCRSGAGSAGSICFLAWIRNRNDLTQVDRSESEFFHQAKIVRKTLIPTVMLFCYFFDFVSFSLVRVIDPRTWILFHTKTSCIRNTAQE